MATNRTIIERTGGIGIDTSDFRTVATALRRAGGQAPKTLRRNLRAAGEIVAVEARAISSEHSKKIPATINVRVASTTVSVVAGGAQAPTGGLFELGNVGGGAKSASANRSGVFRHPVFAPKGSVGDHSVPWVNQDMHPYLAVAAANKSAELLEAVVATLDEATKTITFGS